jgi:hypothetical protein
VKNVTDLLFSVVFSLVILAFPIVESIYRSIVEKEKSGYATLCQKSTFQQKNLTKNFHSRSKKDVFSVKIPH